MPDRVFGGNTLGKSLVQLLPIVWPSFHQEYRDCLLWLLASWSAKCARYTYSSDISLFKCIDHASMMVVRAAVGEDVLILLVYSRCGRPSAHPLPFTFPSLLSFRYMRYFRALILSSSVSWCQCFGVNPSISWIWCD